MSLNRIMAMAALVTCLPLVLTACGTAGSSSTSTQVPEAPARVQRLKNVAALVERMDMMEWHGQLFTKNPDDGGSRVFEITGLHVPSTGFSRMSTDSTTDGQQVDYLLVDDHTYFNSELWGPAA